MTNPDYYYRHVANQQHPTRDRHRRARRSWWERDGELIVMTLGLIVFGYALGILTMGLLLS